MIPSAGWSFRTVAGGAALVYVSTLVVVPRWEYFQFGEGEWHNEELAGLRYREAEKLYVRDFSPHLTDREWDDAVDEVTR